MKQHNSGYTGSKYEIEVASNGYILTPGAGRLDAKKVLCSDFNELVMRLSIVLGLVGVGEHVTCGVSSKDGKE